MDASSSSSAKESCMGKGVPVMNEASIASASSCRLGEQGFRVPSGEPPNHVAIHRNTTHMSPPNATLFGEPLDVIPLTIAMPGEPVVHTPTWLLRHPSYRGGWKVLRKVRENGRVDWAYINEYHGTFRSKIKLIEHLDSLQLQEDSKKSADPGAEGHGTNQSAEGKRAA